MKYLFLFIVLVACSKSDPDPKPKFTDITGNWEFTIDSDNSGSFVVTKVGADFAISSSSIKVNSINCIPQGQTQSISSGNSISFLYFNQVLGIEVYLKNIQIGSNFEIMTASSYSLIESEIGSGSNYEKSGASVSITRK